MGVSPKSSSSSVLESAFMLKTKKTGDAGVVENTEHDNEKAVEDVGDDELWVVDEEREKEQGAVQGLREGERCRAQVVCKMPARPFPTPCLLLFPLPRSHEAMDGARPSPSPSVSRQISEFIIFPVIYWNFWLSGRSAKGPSECLCHGPEEAIIIGRKMPRAESAPRGTRTHARGDGRGLRNHRGRS